MLLSAKPSIRHVLERVTVAPRLFSSDSYQQMLQIVTTSLQTTLWVMEMLKALWTLDAILKIMSSLRMTLST